MDWGNGVISLSLYLVTDWQGNQQIHLLNKIKDGLNSNNPLCAKYKYLSNLICPNAPRLFFRGASLTKPRWNDHYYNTFLQLSGSGFCWGNVDTRHRLQLKRKWPSLHCHLPIHEYQTADYSDTVGQVAELLGCGENFLRYELEKGPRAVHRGRASKWNEQTWALRGSIVICLPLTDSRRKSCIWIGLFMPDESASDYTDLQL